MAQVVEHQLDKQENQSSNPNTTIRKKKKAARLFSIALKNVFLGKAIKEEVEASKSSEA
jgi:hypothetical protein